MGLSFNGTSDHADVPITLNSATKLTIAFWVNFPTYGTGSSSKLIYSDKDGSVGSINGFYAFPHSSTNTFNFGMVKPTNAFYETSFPQISAGAWHHIMLTHDRDNTANRAWVDGIEQSLTVTATGNQTGTKFDDGTLTFAKYGANWIQMEISDFAIWRNILFAGPESLDLAHNVSPLSIRPDRLSVYLPMVGVSLEPVFGHGGSPQTSIVSLTGTTTVSGALGPPRSRGKIKGLLVTALGAVKAITAAPNGVATVAASVVRIRRLVPSSSGAATVTAGMVRVRSFVATSTGVATVTASTVATRVFSAVISGVSSVVAILTGGVTAFIGNDTNADGYYFYNVYSSQPDSDAGTRRRRKYVLSAENLGSYGLPAQAQGTNPLYLLVYHPDGKLPRAVIEHRGTQAECQSMLRRRVAQGADATKFDIQSIDK